MSFQCCTRTHKYTHAYTRKNTIRNQAVLSGAITRQMLLNNGCADDSYSTKKLFPACRQQSWWSEYWNIRGTNEKGKILPLLLWMRSGCDKWIQMKDLHEPTPVSFLPYSLLSNSIPILSSPASSLHFTWISTNEPLETSASVYSQRHIETPVTGTKMSCSWIETDEEIFLSLPRWCSDLIERTTTIDNTPPLYLEYSL